MTVSPQDNQAQTAAQPQNDKEYNFAQVRKQLEQERAARLQAEERAQRAEQQAQASKSMDDDRDDEPYVDHKKLERRFANFESKIDQKIEQKAEQKARAMVEQERQTQWMKNNPDFYDVMQHAQKFAELDPELAETILNMPEGFERQKLVYKNIKALGVHKKAEPEQTIQQKIDANRRSPFYQPSGVGAAPYQGGGDFSPGGQKNAYDKMKELQARLRI